MAPGSIVEGSGVGKEDSKASIGRPGSDAHTPRCQSRDLGD